jgi:hypothetical protein
LRLGNYALEILDTTGNAVRTVRVTPPEPIAAEEL